MKKFTYCSSNDEALLKVDGPYKYSSTGLFNHITQMPLVNNASKIIISGERHVLNNTKVIPKNSLIKDWSSLK